MSVPKKLIKLFLLAQSNLHKRIQKRKLIKDKQKVALLGGILFSCILILISLTAYFINPKTGGKVLGESISRATVQTRKTLISPVVEITSVPPKEPTPTPTIQPTPTPTPKPAKLLKTVISETPTPIINPKQYTAEQLNDNTWRVKDVTNDDRMASANEIVNAINSYRNEHGRGNLAIDTFLSGYAQDRASLFNSRGSLDSHEGFRSFMDNDGFSKAGFNSLGENSAYLSGPMNAEKIVKNIFGADASHDSNQLDDWTHIGVGVNGNAINVNFGKGKR